MSDNPFDAGAAPPPFDGATVNLTTVLVNGTALAARRALHFGGATAVLLVAYVLSICTCVGWIFSLPFMVWGWYRFILSVADGDPRIEEVWSGFEEPGRVFLQGWAIMLGMMVIMSPSIGVGVAAQFAIEEKLIGAMAGAAVPAIAGLFWGALVAPLMYAPLVWADGRAGAMQSFTVALDALKGSWIQVAAISALVQLMMLPTTVATGWFQEQQLKILTASPDEHIELLGSVLGGAAALYLLMFVAAVLSYCWSAMAYRQVLPR